MTKILKKGKARVIFIYLLLYLSYPSKISINNIH
jgi:hypothetical protein